RDAFARFLVAEYASQIKDYSGESFVVDPQTTPESRGGGEIVKTKLLQPGGRTVNINYLVRGERVVDIYLNGTISDLAMRRDEFASVIAKGGADSLIKRLRDRTKNLLGKKFFAPEAALFGQFVGRKQRWGEAPACSGSGVIGSTLRHRAGRDGHSEHFS